MDCDRATFARNNSKLIFQRNASVFCCLFILCGLFIDFHEALLQFMDFQIGDPDSLLISVTHCKSIISMLWETYHVIKHSYISIST